MMEEQKIESVIDAIKAFYYEYPLVTPTGQRQRFQAAEMLKKGYGIPVPAEYPQENEPTWIQELRQMVGYKTGRIPAIFLLAFVEGWMAESPGFPEEWKGYAAKIRERSDSPRIREELLRKFFEAGVAESVLIIQE